ncbi:four helix bundle protein [Lacihabitans sp. LS3-19]|uniref:four helix bundle protein n=1 Tax=Lacihabitans sp. LS3-19 TaxID=2487335 RepID=UPI0020CFE875|nr:four helix bundle protein [Lacihabitans sp. LS3-19]MCP9769541.1 four helix bundle protein [Lacihabitans sp. LS3-19]
MNNPIVDKTFQFSLDVITFCEILEGSKKFVVANQLLKSGTSIGANVVEAQNAESKADFIHKMKIAAKEANETNYWLRICKFAPSYPESDKLLELINEIGKILTKIIATSKSK